jgi:hypothetical protein
LNPFSHTTYDNPRNGEPSQLAQDPSWGTKCQRSWILQTALGGAVAWSTGAVRLGLALASVVLLVPIAAFRSAPLRNSTYDFSTKHEKTGSHLAA